MSSELHELIQKEIAAAEQRIDQAGSYGYQRVRKTHLRQLNVFSYFGFPQNDVPNSHKRRLERGIQGVPAALSCIARCTLPTRRDLCVLKRREGDPGVGSATMPVLTPCGIGGRPRCSGCAGKVLILSRLRLPSCSSGLCEMPPFRPGWWPAAEPSMQYMHLCTVSDTQ